MAVGRQLRTTVALLLGAAGIKVEALEPACLGETCDADVPSLSLLQAEHRLAPHAASAETVQVAVDWKAESQTWADAASLEPAALAARLFAGADLARVVANSSQWPGIEREMALLALHVYGTASDTAGWTVSQQWRVEKDMANLYTKGNECVVAFAGSNDFGDWLSNFNVLGFDLSSLNMGMKAHIGFVRELRKVLTHPDWQARFVPALQKCGTVTSVGHSMGGAVASLFAGLTNANPQGLYFPADGATRPEARVAQTNVVVTRLFTFGSPGLTFGTPMYNARTSDYSFQGYRFFNFGPWQYDPAPTSTRPFSLLHPVVKAVAISSSGTFQEFAATSQDAMTRPLVPLTQVPSPAQHSITVYADRLR